MNTNSRGPGGPPPQRPEVPTARPYDRGDKDKRTRVNHMIRVPRIRVIDPDGQQLGVMNTDEALRLAREKFNLDLVEISPSAVPPVCKILDFGKYKYQLKKKAQETKRNQSVIQVKEVKLRLQTDDHDRDFKIKHVMRFLEDGNKAKVTVFFRGREMIYAAQGREILQNVFSQVQELGFLEQDAILEGRYMSIIIAPKASKGQTKNAENENKTRGDETV